MSSVRLALLIITPSREIVIGLRFLRFDAAAGFEWAPDSGWTAVSGRVNVMH